MQTTRAKSPAFAAPDSALGGPASQSQLDVPLVADMDGTVLLTDTLFEAIADQLRQRPFWTLLQLLCLPFAIARTKARLQQSADIDIDTLPVNAEVLAYCHTERAAGRKVWLVSAADQKTVDEIAARFGVFDRAIGSNGEHNLKGARKGKFLENAFPGGFEYIGDSPADMSVWSRASHASIVGGGPARKRAVERSGTSVARTFLRPNSGLGAWRKAMRLHQWAKNVLIFVAPTLALAIFNPATLITCLIAFPLIGLMASGTYIFNDLLDLKADRAHHSNHRRPFASGRLKLWQGFVAAPLMIATSLAGGALLSTPFAATMLCYLGITLSYSFLLKRFPLLDAAVLGVLFTLRLIMGGVLASVMVTEWLIVFSMFLFVSLSIAKRHVEIVRKAAAGETEVPSRGYKIEDLPLTLGMGLATATATPIIMVLYLIDVVSPSGAYNAPEALWVAPAILSLWLMRIWLLANRGELDDDPVVFAVRDPQSLALGVFLAASFVWAAIAPGWPGMPS